MNYNPVDWHRINLLKKKIKILDLRWSHVENADSCAVKQRWACSCIYMGDYFVGVGSVRNQRHV